jgi:hypothetical protein
VRYLLLIYGDESQWGSMSPEDQGGEMEAYNAFTQWLRDTGQFEAGEALEPTATATTVRVRDGEKLTTDGPFAETKEQLGGFYMVSCENLDQAIEAAAKIPAARGGSIEIRPIVVYEAQPEGAPGS